MEILGLTFVGTRTTDPASMATFVRDVLGLAMTSVDGMTADAFDLPDGTSFAVSALDDGEVAERTVGLLVRDLDDAARELREAGLEVDEEISANARDRYLHFRAPDGRLYELVEHRT